MQHAAPTYFPRSDAEPPPRAAVAEPAVTGAIKAGVTGATAELAATPPGAALLNPPLPPRRPADLAAAASMSASRTSLFAPRSGR